jgi:hypothetical protein
VSQFVYAGAATATILVHCALLGLARIGVSIRPTGGRSRRLTGRFRTP